jgi:hypothetical protein
MPVFANLHTFFHSFGFLDSAIIFKTKNAANNVLILRYFYEENQMDFQNTSMKSIRRIFPNKMRNANGRPIKALLRNQFPKLYCKLKFSED